jgi:hypothetical protein
VKTKMACQRFLIYLVIPESSGIYWGAFFRDVQEEVNHDFARL